MSRHRLMVFACIVFGAFPLLGQEEKQPALESLGLEELMNVHVVTASNVSERLAEAPATVIVISRQDIRERGYTELSEIFDDLPGMDVVRTWGDTYVKNYWRGYRNTIGDPYLLMIDGVVFNHLYFNTTDVMATFPLSNIDRVEIVYGPASSVYGASAFMGVVNVITRKDALRSGSYETIELGGGSNESRLIDGTYLWKLDDFRLHVTARIDNGTLDDSFTNRYEYTKDQYLRDRKLWGSFVDNPSVGGAFSSPRRNRAFEARANIGDFELGFDYFRLDAGYGVEYATDRAQNHAVWARPDMSAHARLERALSSRVRSSTLLRYRTSGVSNDSYFAESLPSQPRAPGQRVRFSYWQSKNSSVSLQQDFDVKVNESLGLRTGVRYEQKDLQKAYDISYGPDMTASDTDLIPYPFPPPPDDASQAPNRITTEDAGVYVQSWYRLSNRHRINLGVRSDHNSKYGGATTLRTGYVGTYGHWGVKALYGEAFEEPNNRLLYGGWDGSGSDPRLRPERSNTIEVSGSYTAKTVSQLLSVYRVKNRDTFVNTVHTAQNLGERKVVGFDYHAQAQFPVHGTTLKLWGYYSRILQADERKVTLLGIRSGFGRIGDLADDKIHLGATAIVNRQLTVSLRGRYISSRDTVETNPVGRVPSYATLDGFVRLDDIFATGVGVALKVTNLTNRSYFEPGVRDASAGTVPGSFDDKGVWHGSAGYFNSLLPQPGREVTVMLELELPRR